MKKLVLRRVKCFTTAHTTKVAYFLNWLFQLSKDNFRLYNPSLDVSPENENLSNCLSNISIWTHHNYATLNLPQNKRLIIP